MWYCVDRFDDESVHTSEFAAQMDELFLFLDEMETLLSERISPNEVNELEDMLQKLCVGIRYPSAEMSLDLHGNDTRVCDALCFGSMRSMA